MPIRKHGVGQMFGRVLGDGMVSSIKGELFLPQAWKGYGFDKAPAAFDEKSFSIPVDDSSVSRLAEELKVSPEHARALLTSQAPVQVDRT